VAEVEHAAVAARLRARCAREPRGTAGSLLADTRADLAALRRTLGDRHPVTVAAADAIAARVHRYAAGLAGRTPEPGYEEARRCLVEALAIAASPRVRRPIADDLADLAEAELVDRCRRAVEEARRVPAEAARRAEALLRTARPLLGQLREWRTEEHGRAAADEVAAAVFLVLTEYVAATGDVATARGALREAVLLAATTPLRRRLMSVL
jgi:hypothetical protein